MEIMTGWPDACLPLVRADILTMPVWFQRSSAQQEKKHRQIPVLTARNSLIAIIVQAAV